MNPDFGYPEINKLNDFYVKYKFTSKIDRSELLDGKEYYPKMNFSIAGEQFSLFVDDEYDDLRKNYPLLVLCIVLRELEGYEFTNEYEVWCNERYLDAKSSQVKDSFNHLKNVYARITQIVGKIESYVSDFDFEMNARAAQKLRRSD